MTHHWDEFTKSLAEESVPRRESLRRLGAVFAAAVLSPVGLGTAFARGRDPCKDFCQCRNSSQQKACLAACDACHQDTSRLCGSCGSYACCREPGRYEYGACIQGTCQYACAEWAVRCNGTCTFLTGLDPDNCGACGNVCSGSTPYCAWGICSACPADEMKCNGVCTDTFSDFYNCGACGNVCYGFDYCFDGECRTDPNPDPPCDPDGPYFCP